MTNQDSIAPDGAPKKRGRTPVISRQSVARAAIDLGFDELTMASVAKHLGVKHSSLYRHVGSREDLVMLAIDVLAGETQWPAPGEDWQTYLIELTDTMWQIYAKHPGLAGELQSLQAPTPVVLYIFASAAQTMIDYGFADEDAVLVVDALSDMTIDSYLSAARLAKLSTPADQGLEIAHPPFAEHMLHELPPADSDKLEPLLALAYDPEGKRWYNAKRELLMEGIRARFNRN